MAIIARPVDTRSGPTLMGRILPGPIKNRVEFGFKKKKPEAGSGQVQVFGKTQPRPDPTRLQDKTITKKTLLYIYAYKP